MQTAAAKQPICDSPPSKRRHIQPPVHGEGEVEDAFVRDASLESIDVV